MTPYLGNTGDASTLALRQALKTALAADQTAIAIPAGSGNMVPIATVFANNPENYQDIADYYNGAASPSYYVVRSDAPTVDIRNAIVGANYTPSDAISGTNAAQHMAASNACIAKQGSLSFLGISAGSGVTTFDATKALNASTLKDATTQLPSGANFANQSGGWANIIPVLQRVVTLAEKVLCVASTINALRNAASARGTQYDGTNGNPDVMRAQGLLTVAEIAAAKAS